MVPGMTERERLAADARRAAWLSEVTIRRGRGRHQASLSWSAPTAKRDPAAAPLLGLLRRFLLATVRTFPARRNRTVTPQPAAPTR
jgi:hypothetical protein